MQGKTPASLIEVTVDRVYFQCSRAIIRSHLWDPQSHVTRKELPSAGMLLEEAKGFTHDEAVEHDAQLPDRQRATLY